MSARRRVVTASEAAWRVGLLGPESNRRVQGWELILECGHVAQRAVTYPVRSSSQPKANGWHPRDRRDANPAPTFVYCELCPTN